MLRALVVISIVFARIAMMLGGNLPFWGYMVYLATALFFIGLLFGNANSMAMEPLGHIAGIGSAVVGALTLLISVPLGTLIARFYQGTVIPIIIGFLLTAALSLLITIYAAKDSADKA